MQTPTNITLNKAKNLLTITFDGKSYPLSAQYLRVYSPSAEVRGHGVGQETLQVDKENVSIQRIVLLAIMQWFCSLVTDMIAASILGNIYTS